VSRGHLRREGGEREPEALLECELPARVRVSRAVVAGRVRRKAVEKPALDVMITFDANHRGPML
jgi:hypothetical protein